MVNIITNSEFNGISPWLATRSPTLFGVFADPVRGSVLRVQPSVSSVSTQVYQGNLVVPVGRYRLTFNGRYDSTNTASPIILMSLIDDLNLANLGLSRQFTLTQSWGSYSFEFDVSGAESGFAGRIIIGMYAQHIFYFDNVMLDSITVVPPPPPPPPPPPICNPPSFNYLVTEV
jgi:hypothetical protein